MLNSLKSLFDSDKSDERQLYYRLSASSRGTANQQHTSLGEEMEVISESMCGWWKPRYLLDHRNMKAFEIMDLSQRFSSFSNDDIDWPSLASLPDYAVSRAREMSAHFPTRICRFENGLATVEWQINPDGMYYRDDDGFGMTDDEEITLVGTIDREMNVVEKFRYRMHS